MKKAKSASFLFPAWLLAVLMLCGFNAHGTPTCDDVYQVNFAIQPDGETFWVAPKNKVTGKLPMSIEADELGVKLVLKLARVNDETLSAEYSFTSNTKLDFVALQSVSMNKGNPKTLAESKPVSDDSKIAAVVFLQLIPVCKLSA